MGKMKENPRCNVICARINDKERKILEDITRLKRKSMSELMREALIIIIEEWEKPYLETSLEAYGGTGAKILQIGSGCAD